MAPKGTNLTSKQERFALNLFKGMSQREAWISAGYSSNYSLATVDKNACLLAAKGKIKERLAELQQLAVDETVSTIIERKRLLTNIHRADITQFMDDTGGLKLSKDNPARAAVAEYDVKSTKYGHHKSIKLHSPLQAIDLLNKMEKIYADILAGFQDNRTINIIVSDGQAKELTENLGKYLIPSGKHGEDREDTS